MSNAVYDEDDEVQALEVYIASEDRVVPCDDTTVEDAFLYSRLLYLREKE